MRTIGVVRLVYDQHKLNLATSALQSWVGQESYVMVVCIVASKNKKLQSHSVWAISFQILEPPCSRNTL
jgi:hypothetical protein